MTNQEQKLLAEIEASNGTLYFDVVYWNVSMEYKQNKRRHQAMESLAKKGLVAFEEEYIGKASARNGRTATWEYTVMSAGKVEYTFNRYKAKLMENCEYDEEKGSYKFKQGKENVGRYQYKQYKKYKKMMQQLGKLDKAVA